jgi:uncharacterized membrane protein YdbT with pleckstrin-like domain
MKDYHKYHFQGQKNGEQILLVVRRHWFNILEQMLMVLGMLFMLLVSIVYLPLLFPTLLGPGLWNIFFFTENFFALLIWITFFLIWIDYYFDVWIVTNLRIVNIEQKGLFNRLVSEMDFSRIQDITTEVIGVIPTFLNYGDVFVQTAAETERFMFRQVPDPYGIKDQLMQLQKERSKQKTEEFRKIMDGENL